MNRAYTLAELDQLRVMARKYVTRPAIWGPKPDGFDAEDMAKLASYNAMLEEKIRTFILAGVEPESEPQSEGGK